MRYKFNSKKRYFLKIPHKIWLIFFLIIIIGVAGTLMARHEYYKDLQPLSSDQSSTVITITEGSTIKQIASQLQTHHLIRSAWAFELYVHAHQSTSQLQAGTYAFSPSQSLSDIVSILSQGKVATRLVTILPGRRVDQIRADLINDGFTPSSVDNALNPANYSNVPALAFKPASVNSLEGLLWPDSFQKAPNTDPSVIIRESLNEMSQHLTTNVQAAFASEGLTTYQGLILSSIVMQEVSKPNDQAQVAQVFLSRLKTGMMLGSDVTALYGSIEAGQSPNLNYNSPYNTLLNTGLPPTPISTINSNALNAVVHPASTSWLYFVTGDDGTTYFSTTLADQQANTKQYCHKLCSN